MSREAPPAHPIAEWLRYESVRLGHILTVDELALARARRERAAAAAVATAPPAPSRPARRPSNSLERKQEILHFAAVHGVLPAARHFGVSRQSIQNWRAGMFFAEKPNEGTETPVAPPPPPVDLTDTAAEIEPERHEEAPNVAVWDASSWGRELQAKSNRCGLPLGPGGRALRDPVSTWVHVLAARACPDRRAGMIAPLTLELAGRQLPALRVFDADPYDRSSAGRAAVLPAGETDLAIGVCWATAGYINLVLADRVACLRAVDERSSLPSWAGRADRYGMTEAEALAQIVKWSR